jgi:cytochrome c-type biogenesis protein CcmE
LTKNIKFIIAGIVIVVFATVGFFSFMGNKIEYTDFQNAQKNLKKVQIKGVVQKDKEIKYDAGSNTFTFYMKDDKNMEMKIILEGAKPNNFDIAESIVATGRVKGDIFYAKDILTKCPSKYEGTGDEVKSKNKNM